MRTNVTRENLRGIAAAAVVFICLTLPVLAGLGSTPAPGPAANAGFPQLVALGSTVHLDGSLSTNSAGGTLGYQWSFVSVPAASAATISGPAAVNPTFVADQSGTYLVRLAVTDGFTVSTSQITISTQQTPPVANAGLNQAVTVGSVVHLDGSGSMEPDGSPLTFQWSLLSAPSGSQTSIANPGTVAPTLYADVAGTYMAQLTVSDTHGNNSTATVTISTRNGLRAPLA